jgi:hypothetical protein
MRASRIASARSPSPADERSGVGARVVDQVDRGENGLQPIRQTGQRAPVTHRPSFAARHQGYPPQVESATEEAIMGESHTPADDIVYDLISIQYHALKGAQVYARYLEDAHGHDDVRQFIEQVQQEDGRRAVRAHELLGKLTKTGLG